MEFQAVVGRRKMVRSFSGEPVPDAVLDQILANALHAPSAGFSQGWAFVVLVGPSETALFWDAISDPEWRDGPARPGLLRAPVIIVPLTDQASYLARYAEPDKAAHGMASASAWRVPYWLVDTSFATMVILLSAVDAGLGALFLGLNHRDEELMAALGVPEGFGPIGAVALGWPDGQDQPSPSRRRGHRPAESVIHRGRW
ncbi:MAG: nitroreductase family protein [Actinomycetota bacterium]|nr:nitroreductase family protein [Actinomycetota bacterium]